MERRYGGKGDLKQLEKKSTLSGERRAIHAFARPLPYSLSPRDASSPPALSTRGGS